MFSQSRNEVSRSAEMRRSYAVLGAAPVFAGGGTWPDRPHESASIARLDRSGTTVITVLATEL